MTAPLTGTRQFVELLLKEEELLVIEDEVDPNLELAQIQREVCKRKGPALLFNKVRNTPFPVATNLYGSSKRIELAFGRKPLDFVKNLAETVEGILPPTPQKIWEARGLAVQGIRIGMKRRRTGPILQNTMDPPDLGILPQIKSWPEDGGAFVTLPLVYTENPVNGKGNLGMYRVQLHNRDRAGMHIQIHRGGGFHYHEAEKRGRSLPAALFIGGPPALTIAAVAPLPEDITELLFASLLMGTRLKTGRVDNLRMIWDADFCVRGSIPPRERMPEGPFGDHYGYYSLQHDYPFLQVEKIHYRNKAVYPATVVGRPPQEDHYIAEFLQDILSPLFPLVMPNVKGVWAYEESGVHSLAAAVVKERYKKEAFTGAIRILSEGQLSLTKFLMVTDQPVELKNFRELFLTVLERADFRTDLHVLSNISQDTLDYTGPEVNEGSKAILLGVGEKRFELKERWEGSLHAEGFSDAAVFCPGALCLKGPTYEWKPEAAKDLIDEPSIRNFRMVFLLDDPRDAVQSPEDFIWHVFTRFEPAADIYGKQFVSRFHIGIEGPVIVDCRLKPWYPKVLEEDPEVAKQVQEKFGELLDNL